ncbi:hypothetical protein ACF3MZ_17885 [Paenibacillaceae bacterium WGS1546]|uniref:hypothetical protein n=1 Tax=Cohnella sp. WGS1546 TaxID=3366810 RepID=UPI00372D6950
MSMSRDYILKTHAKNGLKAHYKFKDRDILKNKAVFQLLQSIRPFIEEYQKVHSDDFHGNRLNLSYPNLARTYAIASRIQHPNDIQEKLEPKKLKNDLKVLAQSVLGRAKYRKIKDSVSKSSRRLSLLDSIKFNDDYTPVYH